VIESKVGEFSRTIHVSVRADRLKVGDILAFADRLREMEIPLAEQVSDDHSHETQHLTGLWVRYIEELPAEREAQP
jgi:hypothetical protein